jgi:large subunit ribosomal protein L22
MRIHSQRLKQYAEDAGVGVDALAQAVERTGLKGPEASSAVRNWMRGSDHPRCRAEDIRRLAQALGRPAKELALFESQVMGTRGSTRKIRLVADLIRGQRVDRALDQLSFTTRRAAVDIKKCLQAAIADAEEAEADVANLYVARSFVGEGMRIKRFQPKDRGRAHAIVKQTSHITVGVEERA